MKLEPAVICSSTPICTCEKARQGQRQPALALLNEMLGVKLEPTTVRPYSTPIRA